MTAASERTRVYVPRGKVAHLLPPGSSPNVGYPFTLCHRQPRLFTSWLGTGSQAEYDKAASLPTCGQCLRDLPESFPAGGGIPTAPPSGRDLSAAAAPSQAAVTARGAASPPGGTAGTPKRADGEAHPAFPSAPEPAPGRPPSHPGAEGGQGRAPSEGPARPPAAVSRYGGREAGPGSPIPGPAQSSPPALQGRAGGEQEPGGTARERTAAAPPGTTPPGTGRLRPAAVPGGAAGVPGREAREAWRRELARQAAAARNKRSRYPVKRPGDGYAPGSARRLPPGGAR